jgi:molecular chaperone DnaK (HSP70)
MNHRVVGIDLGTTYSAVAAFDPDTEQAEIIDNREEGTEATTPSVVAYLPDAQQVWVGARAKRRLAEDPGNVVIEIKREMGEVFDEDRLRKHGAVGSFPPGSPLRVRLAGQWCRPQEVSAFILLKMKEVAELEIGEEILDAVITVPAYFHENQRSATSEAALLAGLYPLQLIAEPTAAAICYGLDRFDDRRRSYLVYDLGGGTFDVSIIQVEGGLIVPLATSGDPRLGGGDFDDLITEWAVTELRLHHDLDIGGDPLAQALIKYEAEPAKVRLSTHNSATLVLPGLRAQEPPVLTLTRERFEELIDRDLTRTLDSVEDALEQARAKGVEPDGLDAVLLVGGSTKIPKVKRMLAEYFRRGDDFVKLDLDPAAVVARGAAIMAGRFPPSPPPFDFGRTLEPAVGRANEEGIVDVFPITEHSLGVGVVGKRVHRLIDRGTSVPASKTDPNFTNEGPYETLEVPVFQGESEYQNDNTLIGTVKLEGLQPRPRGFHRFAITYTLDESGLLSVEVKHLNTDKIRSGSFQHEALLSSESQLEARHHELRRLYAPPVTYAPPPPASVEDELDRAGRRGD